MLIAMSTILNTSVDYILGLTDDPTPSNLTLTEDENALLFNYRQLHDIEKVKVQSYIQGFVVLNRVRIAGLCRFSRRGA